MGIGRVVYKRVLQRIRTTDPAGDERSLRTFAWLVTGMLLEQDVRLPRIALAMDSATTMDARVRRLRRGLESSVDGGAVYRELIRSAAKGWRIPRAFLVLDTTSVGGRVYFARVALRHASRSIPLTWLVYEGRSATIAYRNYVKLLEQANSMLPPWIERVLVADRGFQHIRLANWCVEQAWRFRIRAKGNLGVTLPDETWQKVFNFRHRCGAMRVFDSVRVGSRRLGPLGLILSWPRFAEPDKDPTLHVLSDDPPSVRTLWEFDRREAVEQGFGDDKSSGFQLERSRVTEVERVDQLLAGMALAQLFLKSVGTRLRLDGNPHSVDPHYRARGLSILQLGARKVRMDMYRGRAPKIEVALWTDDDVRGRKGERQMLRDYYARRGLPYRKRWIPPGSFEERNAHWWLPNGYSPRISQDDPPVI